MSWPQTCVAALQLEKLHVECIARTTAVRSSSSLCSSTDAITDVTDIVKVNARPRW